MRCERCGGKMRVSSVVVNLFFRKPNKDKITHLCKHCKDDLDYFMGYA